MARSCLSLVLIAACLGVWAGCGCSQRPPAPKLPKLSAEKAARGAMEEYDANGDGTIDEEEMKKSPPLLEAVEPFEWESSTPTDVNGDRKLTKEEIRDRVKEWLQGGSVVLSQSTAVYLDEKPLEGATVTYEPEKFMGAAIEASSAVTDENGTCYPEGQDPTFPGLYFGLYRVRISKKVGGVETIPACYNSETILGKELAADAPSTHRLLEYHLKSAGE